MSHWYNFHKIYEAVVMLMLHVNVVPPSLYHRPVRCARTPAGTSLPSLNCPPSLRLRHSHESDSSVALTKRNTEQRRKRGPDPLSPTTCRIVRVALPRRHATLRNRCAAPGFHASTDITPFLLRHAPMSAPAAALPQPETRRSPPPPDI